VADDQLPLKNAQKRPHMAAASNRAARLTKLVSDLKKRYKPTAPPQRALFETILFATLLENSPPDVADKVFAQIESSYYDWNEVRVSSRSELAEHMKTLSDPNGSADRLKRTVQSIFETFYKFDLEELKKQNLGQAVKTLTGFDGVTPFVVNYATQNGLAGHAIACNEGVLLALQVMDIITEAEAKKGLVPGLERAIPKSKGVEAMLLMHEMGVEIGRNPYGPAAKKLLTDIDPSCKDRLPKKPKPPEPEPVAAPPEAKAPAAKAPGADKKGPKEADDKKKGASAADAKGKPAAPVTKAPEKNEKKAPDKKPAPAPAKAPAKKVEVKKVEAKKPEPKKPEPKKPAPAAKKPETKKPEPKKPEPKKSAAASSAAKKKPATKAPAKPAAKKAADKKPAKRKPK
jgi:endonuclease III